ncbi:MAG TPA: hypothetical protein VFV61_04330 [Pyrinomonadaceae bacterium]|nr:hypothetical protein [Pyrinomonadaceae bacterium]
MMIKPRIMNLFLPVLLLMAPSARGQEATPTSTADEQQQEKIEKQKRAFVLLEQVVDEAQLLRLPENRVRMQIGAAELLWQGNEGRARSLFSQAAEGVAEMMRATNPEAGSNERRNFNQSRTPIQLRQELVLTAARYDAPLAYQLLAATRPAVTDLAATGSNLDDDLEQRLLAQVAALDPKLALQTAEDLLAKGKYPGSLLDVLNQLRTKDKEAAAKLEDKLLKRLVAANMLTTADAGSLALALLQTGPRVANAAAADVSPAKNQPYLAATGYADLMGSVIDAALKATPQSTTNQQRQNRGRGRSGFGAANQANANNTLTPAEVEQVNARRLLSGLQMLLPRVEQTLPSRALAVRQKISELGLNNNQRANINQLLNNLDQQNSAALMASAAAAPAGVQSRIYRRAALKALDEGNPELARQIAADHLEGNTRDSILQEMELRQLTKKAEGEAIEEARRLAASLPNDEQRVDMLLQLAGRSQAANPKLALQLLEEARQITNKRATSYEQLDLQLRVADAFKDIEPDRSFEIIEPGIMQLNELLAAAATLNGFEVNVFRDGEMPFQGGNGLSAMVARYGQRLGALATKDFERAQTLANRFQLSEPRIVARLAIVRSLLGVEPAVNVNGRRFRQEAFTRRGQ